MNEEPRTLIGYAEIEGVRHPVYRSERAPDSSATSLLPRPEDETPPAAGRPRYPDTRDGLWNATAAAITSLGKLLTELPNNGYRDDAHKDYWELINAVKKRVAAIPVSERSERSG